MYLLQLQAVKGQVRSPEALAATVLGVAVPMLEKDWAMEGAKRSSQNPAGD